MTDQVIVYRAERDFLPRLIFTIQGETLERGRGRAVILTAPHVELKIESAGGGNGGGWIPRSQLDAFCAFLQKPAVEFPCGRIVTARKPKPRHYGEIRYGVPDEAQRTALIAAFIERTLKGE